MSFPGNCVRCIIHPNIFQFPILLLQRPKNLPFNVARTHVGNSLPIYTDVKNGGARVYTIVRRVSGNLDEFVRELRCVCAEDRIIRRGGGFQVPGNHVKAVKNWLYGLGF